MRECINDAHCVPPSSGAKAAPAPVPDNPWYGLHCVQPDTQNPNRYELITRRLYLQQNRYTY